MKTRRALILLAFWMLAVSPGELTAVTFQFEKIADLETPVPSGGGSFTDFWVPLIDDEGRVVFWASFSGDEHGVFALERGELRSIVDTRTSIPVLGSTLGEISAWVGSSAGEVCVQGPVEGSGTSVILAGPPWRVVADDSTIVPGTGQPLSARFGCALDDQLATFTGNAVSQPLGLYRDDGTSLAAVVDPLVDYPGIGFLELDSSNTVVQERAPAGRTVFEAESTDLGVGFFVEDAGTLVPVATTQDIVPGTQSLFSALSFASIDSSSVAFTAGPAAGGAPLGLYELTGGSLSTVVDGTTPAPGGGRFLVTSVPSLDAGSVLFSAIREPEPGANRPGVYGRFPSGLHKVVEQGDLLDGRVVSSAQIHPAALKGPEFALQVFYEDLSTAIYRGTWSETAIEIPTLGRGSLVLLALAILAAALRALRRRQPRSSFVSPSG